MLLTTPSEFALLALVLIAGWLFGLASRSGGAKWKTRYATEREAHGVYRKDSDTRLAAADSRAAKAEARIAELERENERLSTSSAAPVATTRTPIAVAPAAPRAASSARPAYATKRGWFDWGTPHA